MEDQDGVPMPEGAIVEAAASEAGENAAAEPSHAAEPNLAAEQNLTAEPGLAAEPNLAAEPGPAAVPNLAAEPSPAAVQNLAAEPGLAAEPSPAAVQNLAAEPGLAADPHDHDAQQMEGILAQLESEPGSDDADWKSLPDMIASLSEPLGEDSLVSSIPTIHDYNLAYTQEQVEEMMQPAYEMILKDSKKSCATPKQPKALASPAEIGSSPGVVSVDSNPTPEKPRPATIARLAPLQANPDDGAKKRFQEGISDKLSPKQKLLFIELCKQKLQALNDFTSPGGD